MSENNDISGSGNLGKIVRGGLQIAGAVPIYGGIFSAISGAWSEHEQENVNKFFRHWIKMIEDEIKEKEQTIIEIMSRLDLQDEAIATRVESKEYQSLIKKTFREWGAAESDEKRVFIRNILANAACKNVTSDDVIRLFIDWIKNYSELHFVVISSIYNTNGITRLGIWQKIGKKEVKEDSAEADLYKLLIRDLSTGSVIRQHREKDYYGNFIKKERSKGNGQQTMKSAFDNEEEYELTELGEQFVHYAMTDLPLKVTFQKQEEQVPL